MRENQSYSKHKQEIGKSSEIEQIDAESLKRNPEELNRILESLRPRLLSFCRTLVGKSTNVTEDAEEITQQAMLNASRNINSFESESSFSTWLFMIARNVAIDKLRYQNSQARDPRKSEILDQTIVEQMDLGLNPEDLLINSELRKIIENSISRLKGQQLKVAQLKLLEGISIPKISTILGIDIRSAKNSYFLARQKIQSAIAKSYSKKPKINKV